MDALRILFVCCSLFVATVSAAPLKRYDQRQDGELNVQAHLDKILLVIIPNKNINILDIKGQGQFDSYEDILPLLGKESAAVNEVKFKLATDDSKIKTILVPEPKDERKDITPPKFELKIEPKTEQQKPQQEVKKSTPEVRADNVPVKRIETESKTIPESQTTKKAAPKSDGRTYQTVHSANNKERVVAVSNPEADIKKAENSSLTNAEKLL